VPARTAAGARQHCRRYRRTVDKNAVRRRMRAARRGRSPDEQAAAALRMVDAVLDLPELAAAGTVAAYASTAGEPGTEPLRAVLRRRGIRVLLPVLLLDDDLDWAVDEGSLAPGRRAAVLEPTGPRLGPDAVAQAAVVVVPAAAVALDGTRLGHGGGSYDRALPRTTGLVVALVHDDELVDELPRDSHDRSVHVAITPSRTVRLPVRARPGPA